MVNGFMTFEDRFKVARRETKVTIEPPKEKKSKFREKVRKAARADIEKTRKGVEKALRGKLALGKAVTRVPKALTQDNGSRLRKLIGI